MKQIRAKLMLGKQMLREYYKSSEATAKTAEIIRPINLKLCALVVTGLSSIASKSSK